jgi:uncharacterized YccA/Bax inhibitor family protein
LKLFQTTGSFRTFEIENFCIMALFKSGNPTLTEKMFNKSLQAEADMQGTMSVRGTINKFGFMMLMVIAGAAYTWNLFEQLNEGLMYTLMIVGAIGGLITALVITFKPTWARFLAPAYGILEGFFIGGLSAVMNAAFADQYPGLIMQAVGLTFGVAIAMFLLYNFRIINATQKFKSVVIGATMGIAIFYLITMVLRLFGVNVSFMYDSSWLSIGISLFVVSIAALNLIMDFDMIEKGSEIGAPKHMEWYGAFGLMVTIVWLYIEILRLLSKLGSRD